MHNLRLAEQQLIYIERLATAICEGRPATGYSRAIRLREPLVRRGITDLRAFANCHPQSRVASRCLLRADCLQARLDACLML